MFYFRQSNTRLLINILPFPGYRLPPYTDTEFGETITAGGETLFLTLFSNPIL